MSVKAFGIALKLTFAGSNQFTHPSTYVFMIITVVCILTQMNYFNKALSQFPTNMCVLRPARERSEGRCRNVFCKIADLARRVNPLYYVTFTTATLCASFILFSGFNTTDPVNTLSLLCGFLVTFAGVYLLNLSRGDPNGTRMTAGRGGSDTTGTDMVSSIQTRISMEARRSFGPHSAGGNAADRQGLIRAYDEEAAGLGLTDLTEDSDEDERSPMRPNGTANGHERKERGDSIELQPQKSSDR